MKGALALSIYLIVGVISAALHGHDLFTYVEIAPYITASLVWPFELFSIVQILPT